MESHVSKGTQLDQDRTHPAGLSSSLVSPFLAEVTTLQAAPAFSMSSSSSSVSIGAILFLQSSCRGGLGVADEYAGSKG